MTEAIATRVDRVLSQWDWRQQPYFMALSDGSFERADFIETQVQFLWAVTFFSRPMAFLAGKIPHATQRVAVLHNVWEEHGEGNVSFSHSATFRELLARLDGLDEAAINARVLWPEVRSFNAALVGTCLLDEWRVGAATLGIIERMFQEISGHIGRSILAHGWLSPAQLIHYNVHETLDVRHADDFFTLLGANLRDPADLYYIEQGLMQGASAFLSLYAGLWQGRTRRWLRADPFPHLRS